MKFKTSTKDGKLHIAFTVTPEEWTTFENKAYQENKGKYSVPGFRKGHVPRKVIESNYGEGIFFEDALYMAASEYYGEYLDKNKKVEPVARPMIDEKSIKNDDKGVSFTVVTVVKPDVELGEYKGLTIDKTPVEPVTDEEITAELSKVQERNSRMLEVSDRAVAEGDEVNLDYSGSVDGVKFDGGTAEGQKLVIGSHTFIEGFEDQLVGMNIGESKDIEVTFPAEYHSEELAGKPAVFAVTINGITVKEIPTLDDEFAKDVSEFDTLEQYKDDIKANLAKDKQTQAERKDESALVEAVVANAKFVLPIEMIDAQIDDYVEEFSYQLQYQGLKLEDYLQYTGGDMTALRETHRERATSAVGTRLVFEAIVKAEKIKADKKTVNAKVKEYALQIGQDAKTFAESLTEEQMGYFENQVITEKLIALLKAENTIK